MEPENTPNLDSLLVSSLSICTGMNTADFGSAPASFAEVNVHPLTQALLEYYHEKEPEKVDKSGVIENWDRFVRKEGDEFVDILVLTYEGFKISHTPPGQEEEVIIDIPESWAEEVGVSFDFIMTEIRRDCQYRVLNMVTKAGSQLSSINPFIE